MKNEKYIILAVIIVLVFNSLIVISCLKYDSYVNELEEKVQKYEMIENKVGDIDE